MAVRSSNQRWNLTLLAAVSLVGALAGPPHADAALGDCSQPVSSGSNPLASDCLFILGVAVSLQSCTPEPCVCDPTGDGNTAASDALTCLKKAVGEAVALLCPCSTTTTTLPDSDCIHDTLCSNDDCVCPDCDTDPFCSNPSSCNNNGICQPFLEGCVCADCATHPECLDN